MKVKEDGIMVKFPINFLEWFLCMGKSYYSSGFVRVDNTFIHTIFDFEYLNEEQISRLKKFMEKHKKEIPVGIISQVRGLKGE